MEREQIKTLAQALYEQRISVDEAVEEALSLLRHSPWGASVGFDYNGAPGVQVLARPGQMKQVVFNILLNAAQAMRGEGNIEALAAAGADGRVALTIRDDGPGILPQDLARGLKLLGREATTGRGATPAAYVKQHRGGDSA